MSVSIPPKELSRLKTFLGMLGSDHDGEIGNAARRISKVLSSHGLKMIDLPTVLGGGNGASMASEEFSGAYYRERWLDAMNQAKAAEASAKHFETMYNLVNATERLGDSNFKQLDALSLLSGWPNLTPLEVADA